MRPTSIRVAALLCVASVASAAPFAYVPNTGDNTLTVIDTATDTVVTTIPIPGSQPQAAAVSADGMRVYVGDLGGFAGKVHVINAATNTVLTSVSVFSGLFHLAISPDGSRVYGAGGASVKVVNTTSNTLSPPNVSDPATANPLAVAFHPTLPLAYAVGATFQNAMAIDTTTQTVAAASIPTGSTNVVVHPDGTRAFTLLNCTSCFPPPGVESFDTATNMDIPGFVATTGDGPHVMAIDPSGSPLYVTVQDTVLGGSLSVIDTVTMTETTSVAMGSEPWGIALHPDGARLYVVDRGANAVYVVDRTTLTVSTTIPVGSLPISRGAFIGPIAVCGDGQTTFPEQCDDGNTVAGDCCSDTCALEIGLPCDDGEICTDGDVCDANAACAPGPPLDCDDENLCTEDSCTLGSGCINDDTPRTCLAPGKSLLLIKDSDDDNNDQVIWKWLKGAATDAAAFADPTDTTAYALCLYGGPSSTLVAHLDIPAGMSWEPAGAGYKYKDPNGSADGVQKSIVKPGDAGKTKVLIKAKGNDIPNIDLNLLTDAVRIQLVNGNTAVTDDCWESLYTGAEIEADEGKLKGKD
jgi:YVTN family beta-propeller protein/cysteine-rich repeat protein